jgi:colanic acid/amylovoran biosynthesis glycosyltransferase
MRIGILLGPFPVVSEKFILNQIASLLDRGIDVEILTSELRKNTHTHSIVQSYRLLERTTEVSVPSKIANRFLSLPRMLPRILFLHPLYTLRAFHPRYTTASRNLKTFYFLAGCVNRTFDILHCHFGQNGLIGAYLKDIGVAKRLVVTFHGSDITSYPLRHGKGVYRAVYERADAVTVGTQFVQSKLIENGCPPEKIHILPAGVRMEEHPPVPLEERDPFLVLSVGRLVDVKGFRYAIEAFKEVVKRVPQARYLIVGNGPERLMLEGLIRSYGLTGSVELAGEKVDQEVMALYQKASIFVLPAIVTEKGTEEGQGLVLQEAQACGIPVVASRIGGIPEGVLDGTSGFLVPPKDPSTLAEKIIHLLEHPDLRKKMGEAGRTFIQDRFTMDSLAEKWEHLYHAIL